MCIVSKSPQLINHELCNDKCDTTVNANIVVFVIIYIVCKTLIPCQRDQLNNKF